MEGPSSRSTIVGPEGSIISSIAPGGKIITEDLPGVAVHSAPLVHAPLVARTAPWDYSPALLPSAPLVRAPFFPAHGSVDTVVAGPSGTVVSSRSLSPADFVVPAYPHGALLL